MPRPPDQSQTCAGDALLQDPAALRRGGRVVFAVDQQHLRPDLGQTAAQIHGEKIVHGLPHHRRGRLVVGGGAPVPGFLIKLAEQRPGELAGAQRFQQMIAAVFQPLGGGLGQRDACGVDQDGLFAAQRTGRVGKQAERDAPSVGMAHEDALLQSDLPAEVQREVHIIREGQRGLGFLRPADAGHIKGGHAVAQRLQQVKNGPIKPDHRDPAVEK